MRGDQDAARMLGINTTAMKVLAFAFSAMFAAIAGGLTAYQNIHVTPGDFFKIEYTLQMIIATIIGGTGTILGPVLGGGVYQLLSNYVLTRFLELHPTLLGFVIILFIIFLPRWLMPLLTGSIQGAPGRRPFSFPALL